MKLVIMMNIAATADANTKQPRATTRPGGRQAAAAATNKKENSAKELGAAKRPANEFGQAKAPPIGKRMREAFGALRILMKDHGRLDQVLVFAGAVNAGPLARAANSLSTQEEGLALLLEMPRIDREHVDFDALRRMPDGTLGREYTRFLDSNNITPDAFAELPDAPDPRMAFIMLRLRQTHDLWHVLTGYLPDVRGEILLQAFTLAQIKAPSAFLLAFFGTLRWGRRMGGNHLRDLREAYRRGKATKPLAMFRWENEWATPVAELRNRLDCAAVA